MARSLLAAALLIVLPRAARADEPVKLAEFAQMVLKQGQDSALAGPIAETLGFPGEMPSKVVGSAREEATDDLDRNVQLIVQKSTDGFKPLAFVFMTQATRKTPQGFSEEVTLVRLSLKGHIVGVLRSKGRDDRNGIGIKGSAVDTLLEPESPEARLIVQHEMQFWLSKMFRTDLGELRLTNPNATMADVRAARGEEQKKKVEAPTKPARKLKPAYDPSQPDPSLRL